jgi:hypothetical protein
MENAKPDQTKQVRVIFIINLFITVWSFTTVFTAINSHITWKIICAIIGFLGFALITATLAYRLKTLVKEKKDTAAN